MSIPHEPKPAKLFVSVISSFVERIHATLSELTVGYGVLDFVSPLLPFNYTDYYCAEMGEVLFRRFASFEPLIRQEDLVLIKVQTNALENAQTKEGNRLVNIDPGYLVAERLVLASGKNFGHRIYLSKGIYADLTLIYRDKDYQPLPWTYPDYAEPEVRRWLRALRQKYLLQLRSRESTTKNTKSTKKA